MTSSIYDKKVLVLLGPTGVGKTQISLDLAEILNCPIISADSRQLYKGLSIGTDAPKPEQLNRVQHHMIGVLNVDDYYSASQYENDALNLISKLHEKHDVLIITGGSMMYIDALCNGIDEIPTIDSQIRNELQTLYKTDGLEPIKAKLKILDPVFYSEVDLKNHKRVIHALEVCLMSGQPYSSLRKKTKKPRSFQIIKIGLTRDRDELYERINTRVDKMIDDGLIDEAQLFYSKRHCNSLNTVGYKEIFKYLENEWSKDFAIEKIKQNTRIYARKQITWFKRDKDIYWINLSAIDLATAKNIIVKSI